MKEEFELIKKENDIGRKRIRELGDKLDVIENQNRRKNLVITGIMLPENSQNYKAKKIDEVIDIGKKIGVAIKKKILMIFAIS